MSHPRIPALAFAALLALGAAVTASAETGQRALMKQCNVEASARHLMGRSRQRFMQTCLSSPGGRRLALNSQQRRMQYCNAQARAKGLRGADQRRYVNSCLRVR
jgi:hypothetical protein